MDYATTNPASQTVNTGDTVTFTAASSNPGGNDTVEWGVSTAGATTFSVISGATSTTYSFTASGADNGNEYEAAFTNSDGTFTSSPATLTVNYVAADQTALGPSNDTAAGFTIYNAVTSSTFTYTAQSSGGSATVSHSGTLTSTSQDVTGIDVSSLPAGTLTYTVTLASDPSVLFTATVPLKLIPSNYTIAVSPTELTGAAATNTGFTFSGAETGTTYNYTITDKDGSTVTGSGSVTSATQQVSGVDVSSLANGTLTFNVVLSDQGGDVGAAATATATLAILSVTPAPPTTATVGQAYTYTVQTNAPNSDTVTVAVASGTTLPGDMTLTGNTVTWTPTADEAGTSPSYTLTVTDTTTGGVATVGPVFVAVAAANGLSVIAPPATLAIGSPELIAVDDAAAGATFSAQASSGRCDGNLPAGEQPGPGSRNEHGRDGLPVAQQLHAQDRSSDRRPGRFEHVHQQLVLSRPAEFHDPRRHGRHGEFDPRRIESRLAIHHQRPVGNGQRRRGRQQLGILRHRPRRYGHRQHQFL